ncbi:MAG: hypothetical protein KC680_03315 [Candidatus Peregrinibacteria bacterium]|nr:hypothetical protein [Candidatus Peregrinibacteria bacterium]MCB9808472.1 hypothetical protein [Candidatus Peribacteria bacterium]
MELDDTRTAIVFRPSIIAPNTKRLIQATEQNHSLTDAEREHLTNKVTSWDIMNAERQLRTVTEILEDTADEIGIYIEIVQPQLTQKVDSYNIPVLDGEMQSASVVAISDPSLRQVKKVRRLASDPSNCAGYIFLLSEQQREADIMEDAGLVGATSSSKEYANRARCIHITHIEHHDHIRTAVAKCLQRL